MTALVGASPAVDAATRREFIAILGVAGLLTACGSDDGTSGDTRSVEHRAGRTEIPVDPKRIVVLETTLSAGLIALGYTPVGMRGSAQEELGDLVELLPGNPDLSAIAEVSAEDDAADVEGVAAARPDLIVTTENYQQQYDLLQQIAPTVSIFRGVNGEWRARFEELARVLGRLDRWGEADAAYEQRIAELPGSVRTTPTAFVRYRPGDGQVIIDSSPKSFAGSVAADAGIPSAELPPGVGEGADDFTLLSGERLGALSGADLLVVANYALPALESNPLWARLPAVRANRVLVLSDQAYNGGNVYAAQLLLKAVAGATAS